MDSWAAGPPRVISSFAWVKDQAFRGAEIRPHVDTARDASEPRYFRTFRMHLGCERTKPFHLRVVVLFSPSNPLTSPITLSAIDMGAFNHARYQTWAALLAGLTTAITASVLPENGGILEVDLLFPGNSTYTPQALMPIVFAVQNPTLVPLFDVSIGWSLWEGNNQSSPGSIIGGIENFVSSTPPNPLLITRIVNTIAYPDGVWTLAWSVSFLNCTPPETEPKGLLQLNSATTFTVSASGRAPDLVAATSAQMCGITNGIALNATAFGDNCGVLAPKNATATPCAATINSAAASSIYAEATETACSIPQARQQNPNVTCPTSTGKPSASSPGAAGRIAAASTLLMLLTTFTASINLR
ncbi:unnamed protein product [Sphagnum balticum]